MATNTATNYEGRDCVFYATLQEKLHADLFCFSVFSYDVLNSNWVAYLSQCNPLQACTHIRPTPRNTIMVCLLPALWSGLSSTREPSIHSPPIFSTSLSVTPPPISAWGPVHCYSWYECRWHSVVDTSNPPPSCFSLPLVTRWTAPEFAYGAPHCIFSSFG